ncbi:hypothetical protein POM88_033287 [Heracleum sosnowskyi]|uniref:Uncharacterized protein n=1 Tax=Heracleum sosnowskyi TaxID=360622 RepID=A0AAD8I0X1_9APIA|nr:hypothetical protein POM88_033284 [Heracleum sosnowskyi]KAK1377094.1 hypothetical protein POM88_033287 [Heracleum sosnowskyi]
MKSSMGSTVAVYDHPTAAMIFAGDICWHPTVMADKKQRFSIVEDNGELFIRANQGHTLKAVMADKKQRFSLVEDNGELFIRANQGHTPKVYGLSYNHIFC